MLPFSYSAFQTEEVLIGILEKATSVCGADIVNGAGLWGRLIDIHLENLEDLIDTAASSDAIQCAKETIVSTASACHAKISPSS